MNVATVQSVLGALAAVSVLAALVRVPVGDRAAWRLRVAGVAGMVLAWAGLVVTLAPGGPDGVARQLSHPLRAAAALVGMLIALAVGLVAARLVARHPTWWFVALAVALPLRIPVPLGGETRNLLLPLYAVVAVGVLAWFVGRPAAPRSPLNLPLAAVTAFSLVSIAWSVDRTEGATKAVFFYVPFVLLYLAVLTWWPKARAARALGLTTVAVAVPVALLAVWQYQTETLLLNDRLQQANRYSSFFRANAIFFDPNIMGRFLVVAMLVVVAIAWLRRDRVRDLAACGLVLVPLCGGLAVSFSRSSCLMLLTGLVMMAAWAFGVRRTAVVTVALAVVLGGAAFASSGHVRKAATDAQRLNKVSEGRFDLMRGGYEIWREAPVHGAGLGGFEKRYEETLTPQERRKIRVVISHNAPITVLSELGIVGIGLLGWLMVQAAVVVRRRARASGPVRGWLAWTMLATLAGILVHTLLYSALFEDPYNWVLLAGAVAITAVGAAVTRPEAPPAPGEDAAAPN